MDEQTKAAFASAADTSKQLITLATALLALEITFAKDIVIKLSTASKGLIAISWVFMLLSVVAGIWTLLALTGCLSSTMPPKSSTINDTNVRVPAISQILLFLSGLALTVAFGILWVL